MHDTAEVPELTDGTLARPSERSRWMALVVLCAGMLGTLAGGCLCRTTKRVGPGEVDARDKLSLPPHFIQVGNRGCPGHPRHVAGGAVHMTAGQVAPPLPATPAQLMIGLGP